MRFWYFAIMPRALGTGQLRQAGDDNLYKIKNITHSIKQFFNLEGSDDQCIFIESSKDFNLSWSRPVVVKAWESLNQSISAEAKRFLLNTHPKILHQPQWLHISTISFAATSPIVIKWSLDKKALPKRDAWNRLVCECCSRLSKGVGRSLSQIIKEWSLDKERPPCA